MLKFETSMDIDSFMMMSMIQKNRTTHSLSLNRLKEILALNHFDYDVIDKQNLIT
jgi:hypothetical protein